MEKELEIKFYLQNVEDFRQKLQEVNAVQIAPEKLFRRIAFHLPETMEIKNGWGRVRDEGDKITLSIKVEEGDQIEDQKEICLNVDSLENAVEFLTLIGFKEKAYQETKREKWSFKDVDITIDTWPFLDTFVEIEGKSIEQIKEVCKSLDLDYGKGMIGPVTNLYAKRYSLTADKINNETPLIVFNMKNPFLT